MGERNDLAVFTSLLLRRRGSRADASFTFDVRQIRELPGAPPALFHPKRQRGAEVSSSENRTDIGDLADAPTSEAFLSGNVLINNSPARILILIFRTRRADVTRLKLFRVRERRECTRRLVRQSARAFHRSMYPSRMAHDTMTGHLRRYLRRRSVANVSIEEGRIAGRSIYEENKNFTEG